MTLATANRHTESTQAEANAGQRALRPNGGAASHTRGAATIHLGRAEHHYASWPTPTCIIADGPYGVSGFPGDVHTPASLADWYAPHISTWSERATPQTTLWLWNTEVGWASIHPLLLANGWEYRCCHIWDKGLGHIAGNANTRTLRKYPVVTEVCAQYVKAAQFLVDGEQFSMQQWLRHEWRRAGLPLRVANDACGVRNAATRKYLTADHLWYYPPVEMFAKLASYANEHGAPAGRPYYSIDGKAPSHPPVGPRCAPSFTATWASPMSGANRKWAARNASKEPSAA